ncbi:MAG: stage V sporulation protein D [Clostridiaceae bacterium]|nr:stage V sporulation protein D [Clostridiaceae bacterium]
MRKENYRDKATMKKRMSYALIAIIGLLFILTLRLSYIMIVKQKEYSAMAEEQWTSEVKIDAKRGRILDTNGVELAVSANVYRIDFDLNSIRNYLKANQEKGKGYTSMEQLAPVIAEATGLEEKTVLGKLETKLPSGADAGSATLVRRIEKSEADKVNELNISGVIVSPDTKRYYKNNNFLSHVLGTTNIDGKGLAGVELQYNDVLSGTPGVKIAELDRQNEDLPYTISQYTEPVDGKDVTLTIDERIQYFAEKITKQALSDQKAKAVSVLVMNPNTGEILAMANAPDFDPNNPYDGVDGFEGETYQDKLQKMWRNRLVNDTFEPGSIFKVITAITAMENNVVSDSDTFVCNGSDTIGSTTIHCWKSGGHGTQPFPDIIKNSCNVGFMKLGSMIGKEKLYESIKNYGFGQTSGIDLPGEAKGIVKTPEKMSDIDLATVAFGQTNTVNSVQYMAAFNAVANGGTWIQPHVMKQITHNDSNGTTVIDKTNEPNTRTVASKEKTALLRTYLERVVTEGSGQSAFIEGYHIAGKTGTAQKVINGRYGEGKYISSFVGMAPVDNPQVTVMITVDEPSNNGEYYASQVSAPYAHTLFSDIFNYMEGKFAQDSDASITKEVIIPEVRGLKIEEAKKKLKESGIECEVKGNGDTVKTIKPYPGYTIKEGSTITLYTNDDGGSITSIVMPDLKGYSLEDAQKVLNSLGLKCTSTGSGSVVSQSIPKGEVITKTTVIKLELNAEYADDTDAPIR